jgi:hypothetical protein
MSANPIAEAFEAFNETHQNLVQVLEVGRLLDDRGRRSLSILGWDIRDCVGLLVRLHRLAYEDLAEEHAELNANRPPLPPPEVLATWSDEEFGEWVEKSVAARPPGWQQRFLERAARRETGTHPMHDLIITYKNCLVLIRAYQDGLARLLRFALEGVDASRTTMTKLLKKEPPTAVAARLAESLPNYAEWFWDWRNLRNRVKDGAETSMVGIGTELGASFLRVPAPKGQEGMVVYKTIFLGEVDEALRQSAAVAGLAIELLRERLDVSRGSVVPDDQATSASSA